MKTRVFLIALIGLGISGCGGPKESEPGSSEGTQQQQAEEPIVKPLVHGAVSMNDTTMDIVEVFAIWGDSKDVLNVYLFPAPLTEDERTQLADKESMNDPFFVVAEKESPDPAKWEWHPFAEMEIRFMSDGPRTVEGIEMAGLVFHGIEQKNRTTSIMSSDVEEALSVLAISDDDKLTMICQGERTFGNVKWNIEVEDCPIVP